MRIVKAAGVQLNPVLYSRDGTVDKVVRKIHELGQHGLQFATFPETVVPYYPYSSFVQPPLATEQILETVERQVDESVRAGARLLTGGEHLDRPGYFYLV